MGSGTGPPLKPPGRPRTNEARICASEFAVLGLMTRGSRAACGGLLFQCRAIAFENESEWALAMRAIKPIERLVPVSSMRCRTYTPGLSTWWSTTALKGELVSRWVSRLDAFSDYPVRT